MTPPAFTAAVLLIMSSTIGLATHSTTQSGLSGISESAGTQGRPSRFWYFGLIAYTLPVKADRLDRVRSPNDPRVSDAPTMATTLGSIKRRRSSWGYSARAVVEVMFNPYSPWGAFRAESRNRSSPVIRSVRELLRPIPHR